VKNDYGPGGVCAGGKKMYWLELWAKLQIIGNIAAGAIIIIVLIGWIILEWLDSR
jgi:hypothetical protein